MYGPINLKIVGWWLWTWLIKMLKNMFLSIFQLRFPLGWFHSQASALLTAAGSSRFSSHHLGCKPSANGNFPFQDVSLVWVGSHAPPSLNRFLGSGNIRFWLSWFGSADHPVAPPWPSPESASPHMEPWVLFTPSGMDNQYCREKMHLQRAGGQKYLFPYAIKLTLIPGFYLACLNHSYISTFEDNGF